MSNLIEAAAGPAQPDPQAEAQGHVQIPRFASRYGTCMRGQYHDIPVWFQLYKRASEQAAPSLAISVPLGPRPICLWLHRSGARFGEVAPPKVPLADASFEAAYQANGYPAEVVRAVFDEQTRRMVDSLDLEPSVKCWQRHLHVSVTVERLLGAESRWPRRKEQPAAEASFGHSVNYLQSRVHFVCHLAARMMHAYDRQLGGLEPAAAQAWTQQLQQLEGSIAGAREEERGQIRMAVGIVIAVTLVGVVAMVIVMVMRTM